MAKYQSFYTDEEFFSNRLNLTFPGMEAVREAVNKNDYVMARHHYANYIRSHLKPDQYFSVPYGGPENNVSAIGETELESAARICMNCFCIGELYQFGSVVNWQNNPSLNGYPEVIWGLNRHNEWKLLAHVYRQTGDEKFANKCAEFFHSWFQQACYPGPTICGAPVCWRTIECGIRMGGNWPYALHAFYQSSAFTDDILVDWANSTCAHGTILRDQYKHGNWLIIEMNGLAQIAIIFPEFQKSGEWLRFALRIMEEELTRQIYPDGFQYELSTNYHEVVLQYYFRLIEVMNAYGMEISNTFWPVLEKASEVYVKLMQPDGRLPDLNDGSNAKAASFLERKLPFFPLRRDFQWVVSEEKEGEMPAYHSVSFPYAGIMVMRSGWEKDAVWALFDAGPFGRGHQHEDKLSLLFYANGKLLLTEGGNYAYDSSEMRRYVLSTRAHNTVRVDGQDQNRQQNYHWREEEIALPSEMQYRIEDSFDFAQGSYEEGYGPECDRSVIHRRAVYFFKEGLFNGQKPFMLVVDRMYSEKEHEYEALWHLENGPAVLKEGCAEVPGLHLLYSAPVNVKQVCGQTAPEWQGWIANSLNQGDFRPIHTLKWCVRGSNSRFATVLDPFHQFNGVTASEAVDDSLVKLQMSDGQIVILDENKYRDSVE